MVEKKRGNPSWRPGISGNPHGRAINPDISALRKENSQRLISVLREVLDLPIADVQKRLESDKISSLEAIICRLVLAAQMTADPSRLHLIFDRLCGKLATPVDMDLVDNRSFHARLVDWMQTKQLESQE